MAKSIFDILRARRGVIEGEGATATGLERPEQPENPAGAKPAPLSLMDVVKPAGAEVQRMGRQTMSGLIVPDDAPLHPQLTADSWKKPVGAVQTTSNQAYHPNPLPGVKMNKAEPMWLNKYPVLDPDDVHGLEQDAAINEFGGQMPRQDAEAKAHEGYVKKLRLSAAAHHFNAMKGHQASGDMETAKKHGMMYELQLKELGLDPYGPVPNEILHAAAEQPIAGRFRPHPADAFILHKKEEILADLQKGDVVPFRAPEGPNPDQGQNAQVTDMLNEDYNHMLPDIARNQGLDLRVKLHQGVPSAILSHGGKPVLRAFAYPGSATQLDSFESEDEAIRRRLTGAAGPSQVYSHYIPYITKAFDHFNNTPSPIRQAVEKWKSNFYPTDGNQGPPTGLE